ncbi:MAG TPA: DUF4878 domain-containing protein [Thiotrichaceae bacterium]|jgi:hypothetical protein|nr:DUF4878 domain-containing protein [Thiotrichaceae bacterium]HIM08010.1 DUF4878 domain-containing protein [Gammaproteobacteria bacterium]
MKLRLWLLIILPLLMGGGDSYPDTPEQVVAHYLRAIKNYDFPEAHLYLTDEMTRGADAFNWSVEQKQIYKYAEVKVNGYKVYEAMIEGDKASVPNILSSRDKFLNKSGADEYEIYILIKINGYWTIDRQRLVNEKDKNKWFNNLVISSN